MAKIRVMVECDSIEEADKIKKEMDEELQRTGLYSLNELLHAANGAWVYPSTRLGWSNMKLRLEFENILGKTLVLPEIEIKDE